MADTALVETQPSEVAVQQERSLISIIDRVLTRPDIDMDKIERFLDMQRQIEAEQAERVFNEQLAEMQAEIPAIRKRGKSHLGKYATWEDIQEAALPVLKRYGFSISHKTRVEGETVVVMCVLRHAAGHCDMSEMPLPMDKSGGKADIHAIASSIAYGKRYTASALLSIRVEGEDDDGKRGARGKGPSKDKEARELYSALQGELQACMNAEAVREWRDNHNEAGTFDDLPDDWFKRLAEEAAHRETIF